MVHGISTAEAWASVLEESIFIRKTAKKFSRRGAFTDPDEFEQDLIEDVVTHWEQRFISPKTGERRQEVVHVRTFIFMRARKMRTYANREIEKQRKFIHPNDLNTCTGRMNLNARSGKVGTDNTVKLPCRTKDANDSDDERKINKIFVHQVLQIAFEVATQDEAQSLQTLVRDCDRKEIMKRTGFSRVERDLHIRNLAVKIKSETGGMHA